MKNEVPIWEKSNLTIEEARNTVILVKTESVIF